MITVKEVTTKKDRKAFFRFPLDLYKGNKYVVPALIKDEEDEFNPEVNDAYRYYGVSGKEMEQAVSNGYSSQKIDQISQAVDVMKEYNCDALGIEDNIYRHNFKAYKNLSDTTNLFKNTQFSYEVIINFI